MDILPIVFLAYYYFATVTGFLPDGPFFPFPPGGGAAAVAIVPAGPAQTFDAGPLISPNNAFYDNIPIFPVVNANTGGVPAQRPCFTAQEDGMIIVGCIGMAAGGTTVESCTRFCLTLGFAACAAITFNPAGGADDTCNVCTAAVVANGPRAPATLGQRNLFRNRACGAANFPALVFGNIRRAARVANTNANSASAIPAQAAFHTATTMSTVTQTPPPSSASIASPSTTSSTTTQTTAVQNEESNIHEIATNYQNHGFHFHATIINLPASHRNNHQTIINVPLGYPSTDLQMFVTSLIKLGYRSITLNSKIRGGVPLCRICDQYSCISACLVIGKTKCEGVVFNLETQTCYGHRKGTRCNYIANENTSFYASKVKCDNFGKSTTALKYGNRILHVHRHPRTVLSKFSQFTERSLDASSVEKSLLLSMIRHVANNYGFLLVPPNDAPVQSLELLRDFRPIGKSEKYTESTDLKMWRNDDQERKKARLHSALWMRMPVHQGTTSGKWIEHKHYHVFGGSLLAENVTKQACVSECKMKMNCKSVDFDVIIKSCWMHDPSPRCTALTRRQNVLHIRTSQCKRRSSDFL